MLGLSPGTITATVKRLADRGFVDHRPYQGVSFTDAGQQTAVAAIRRHRIVERFLADMLGYAVERGRPARRQLRAELPDEVLERLFVALHRPATCPHGFPIPPPTTPTSRTPALYALEPGDEADVAVPGSTDPELVTFLDTLGLVPGVGSRSWRSTPSTVRSSSPSTDRTAPWASASPVRSSSPVGARNGDRHQLPVPARPTTERKQHEQHPGR